MHLGSNRKAAQGSRGGGKRCVRGGAAMDRDLIYEIKARAIACLQASDFTLSRIMITGFLGRHGNPFLAQCRSLVGHVKIMA